MLALSFISLLINRKFPKGLSLGWPLFRNFDPNSAVDEKKVSYVFHGFLFLISHSRINYGSMFYLHKNRTAIG